MTPAILSRYEAIGDRPSPDTRSTGAGRMTMQPDVLDHTKLDQVDRSDLEHHAHVDPSGVIALIAGAFSGASVVAMIWLFTAIFL